MNAMKLGLSDTERPIYAPHDTTPSPAMPDFGELTLPAPEMPPTEPVLPEDEEPESEDDRSQRPLTRADFRTAPFGICSTCRGYCRVHGGECADCYSDRTETLRLREEFDDDECPECDGSGRGRCIVPASWSFPGEFEDCWNCHGTGVLS